MKANVNRDLCIGCAGCERACPEVFMIDTGGIARVISADPPRESYADIQGCVEMCPMGAISVAAE